MSELDALRAAVADLLDVLAAVPEPERQQAAHAHAVIARDLARLHVHPGHAMGSLAYDVGGKGMFDWYWAPATEARLLAAVGPVWAALRAAR